MSRLSSARESFSGSTAATSVCDFSPSSGRCLENSSALAATASTRAMIESSASRCAARPSLVVRMLFSVALTSCGSIAARSASPFVTIPSSLVEASAIPFAAAEPFVTRSAMPSEFWASAPVNLRTSRTASEISSELSEIVSSSFCSASSARERIVRAPARRSCIEERVAMIVGFGCACQIGGRLGEPPAISM